MINGENMGEKDLGGRTETGSLSPLALFLFLSSFFPLGSGTAMIPLYYVHTFFYAVSLERASSRVKACSS
jgi:hypothetical protein